MSQVKEVKEGLISHHIISASGASYPHMDICTCAHIRIYGQSHMSRRRAGTAHVFLFPEHTFLSDSVFRKVLKYTAALEQLFDA
jgi:hypothetical protein